ncbi:MAG: hypothetical protein ACRD17_12215, partial [Terriglobales bacterium]
AGAGWGAKPAGGGAAAPMPTQRADTAVLWKLDAGHHLVPVRVRTGITNFTATAVTVLQGSLAPGDRLVTGVVMQSQGLSPMAARRFR